MFKDHPEWYPKSNMPADPEPGTGFYPGTKEPFKKIITTAPTPNIKEVKFNPEGPSISDQVIADQRKRIQELEEKNKELTQNSFIFEQMSEKRLGIIEKQQGELKDFKEENSSLQKRIYALEKQIEQSKVQPPNTEPIATTSTSKEVSVPQPSKKDLKPFNPDAEARYIGLILSYAQKGEIDNLKKLFSLEEFKSKYFEDQEGTQVDIEKFGKNLLGGNVDLLRVIIDKDPLLKETYKIEESVERLGTSLIEETVSNTTTETTEKIKKISAILKSISRAGVKKLSNGVDVEYAADSMRAIDLFNQPDLEKIEETVLEILPKETAGKLILRINKTVTQENAGTFPLQKKL